MKFTKEQIAKAAEAKSAEEPAEPAEKNGIRLSPKQAEQFFAGLHREGELPENELDAVAGGIGEPAAPNQDGYDVVNVSDDDPRCPVCGNRLVLSWTFNFIGDESPFDRFQCQVCPSDKSVYRRYWTGCLWTKDFRD